MDYAGRHKYDLPGRAERYRDRSAQRNEEEWLFLARVLDTLPPPVHALDVPCGTGRIAERLLLRGLDTSCGDLSPAMREATTARLEGLLASGPVAAGVHGAEAAGVPGAEAACGQLRGVHAIDLEAATHTVEPADLVVCFRFFHHLPSDEARRRALRSLRTLTQGHLVLSFFHPVSAHNVSRQIKARLRGRPSDRHTIRRRTLSALAKEAGFEPVSYHGLAPWRRDLWLGVFR